MSRVDRLVSSGEPVSPDDYRGRADVVRLRAFTVGFVNIMPDAGFEASEQSFLKLIEAAGMTIDVRRYTLPGVRRSADMDRRVKSVYRTIDQLKSDPPDAMIITGTEPLEAHLGDEAYWEPLADLIRWCSTATVSAFLSCLAAHAAILLFDGVERRPLPRKLSGVFDHDVVEQHALVDGLPDVVSVPHSRLNDVPADELRRRQYSILLDSPSAGWSLGATVQGRCLFVLNQGHPEYAPTSLLKEYRRDMRRYLDGATCRPPDIPDGYLTGAVLEHLRAYHSAVVHGGRPEPIFPNDAVDGASVARWRPAAERLFANWLAEARRRAVAAEWC
jgi:homoserine O-succinyltransferase